ncbi:hypothetical protein DsansV1_C09g0087301 [Dioscorea sansibarensis]
MKNKQRTIQILTYMTFKISRQITNAQGFFFTDFNFLMFSSCRLILTRVQKCQTSSTLGVVLLLKQTCCRLQKQIHSLDK